MQKNIKIFPDISSENPWSFYETHSYGSKLSIFREKQMLNQQDGYLGIKAINHNISEEGYIELKEGQQSWAKLGCRVGDRFSFVAGCMVYEVLEVYNNVVKVKQLRSIDKSRIDTNARIVVPNSSIWPLFSCSRNS